MKRDIDYLIVISGMEPQRTALEKILMRQIPHLPGRKVVLLGKPATDQIRTLEDGTGSTLLFPVRKNPAHVTGAVYYLSFRVYHDDGYR